MPEENDIVYIVGFLLHFQSPFTGIKTSQQVPDFHCLLDYMSPVIMVCFLICCLAAPYLSQPPALPVADAYFKRF